jgi:hypothetical protein
MGGDHVKGDFFVEMLRNDLLGVRAVKGKIQLFPKERIQQRHREIVRQHEAAIVAALGRYPDNEAHPRHVLGQPGRSDELGRDQQARPQVVTRRRR